MTYPPQSGQYPAPPPYAYWPNQFPPQSPNGATAITAGVLACLGTLWAGFFALINFALIDKVVDEAVWIAGLQAISMLIELCTLLPGAILLFLRKSAGRWLVAAGSAIHILQSVIALIGVLSLDGVLVRLSSRSSGPAALGSGVVWLLILMIPAIATLVLALVPLTGDWCKPDQPQIPPQQWMPSYPGAAPQQWASPQTVVAPTQPGETPEQWAPPRATETPQ